MIPVSPLRNYFEERFSQNHNRNLFFNVLIRIVGNGKCAYSDTIILRVVSDIFVIMLLIKHGN
jgi:hypothetical protein